MNLQVTGPVTHVHGLGHEHDKGFTTIATGVFSVNYMYFQVNRLGKQ